MNADRIDYYANQLRGIAMSDLGRKIREVLREAVAEAESVVKQNPAAVPDAVELFRIWQTWLGSDRESSGNEELWDRIDRARAMLSAAPVPSAAARIAELERERDGLLSACRRAVLALARVSEKNPAYIGDYESVSNAIARRAA